MRQADSVLLLEMLKEIDRLKLLDNKYHIFHEEFMSRASFLSGPQLVFLLVLIAILHFLARLTILLIF